MNSGHMAPRLIITDIDGTLIDRSEAINPSFDELAQLIDQHKLNFTIASGRNYGLLQVYINKLGITAPVIINNGAGARQGDTLLWDEILDPLSVKPAILRADALDMAIFMCTGSRETVYRHNAYIQHEIDVFERYNHFYIPLQREWPTLQLQKVMITDPQKPGRIDEIIKELEPYGDKLNVIRYDDRHIDIMKKGVTKGGAVARLAQLLNIPLAQAMAIGDGENDIEMLCEVGIGVAVGNAKDVLKQHADYVCQESHTAGVVEAVRKFCT